MSRNDEQKYAAEEQYGALQTTSLQVIVAQSRVILILFELSNDPWTLK